jgi:cysteine desulfurase
VVGTSTLPRVAHLTKNFTSESPLSPAVREAISAAFEQGWADPKKQSQAAGRSAILAESAKEEIASHLFTTPSNLEVVGEPSMAHFIALSGFTRDGSHLLTSTIDLGKIRAIARAHKGEVTEIGVDHLGQLIRTGLRLSNHSLFSLQATNGETGISQDIGHWRDGAGHVVVDATKSLPVADYVTGFAATTFDAMTWGGPTGLGFIAISDAKNFRYPLPRIAPIRVPGSYSLPLLIGSAVALSENVAQTKRLIALRNYLFRSLQNISGLTVIGESEVQQSQYLSAVIDDISAEELLRTLLTRDIAIDAGSACNPEDLAPSHVIASMGFPTTGHIRFTIHPHHSEADVDELVRNLSEVLVSLRR